VKNATLIFTLGAVLASAGRGGGGSTEDGAPPPATTKPVELARGVELPAACEQPEDAVVSNACDAWVIVASRRPTRRTRRCRAERNCRFLIGAEAPRGALDWADLGALIERGIDTNAERRKTRRLTALVQEQGREVLHLVESAQRGLAGPVRVRTGRERPVAKSANRSRSRPGTLAPEPLPVGFPPSHCRLRLRQRATERRSCAPGVGARAAKRDLTAVGDRSRCIR
jgi:hypothetical protein